MTTSWNGSRPLPQAPDTRQVPLSTYTEQRLANMARFTSRLTNTESGFCELTLAQEAAVRSLGQLLVAKLRDREKRRH